MTKFIDMWIDKDGDVFFDDYFEREDAPKLKEFIENKLGYTVNLEEDKKREFKPVPAIWKKKVVRDINWSNYNNILYIINNRDKTDIDIVKGLHSAGSGFSITVKRGTVMTEYSKLLEAEGNKPSPEKLIEFAKKIANKFMKGKRIGPGAKVLANFRDTKLTGEIKAHKDGEYEILFEDGSIGMYKRSEFELD